MPGHLNGEIAGQMLRHYPPPKKKDKSKKKKIGEVQASFLAVICVKFHVISRDFTVILPAFTAYYT